MLIFMMNILRKKTVLFYNTQFSQKIIIQKNLGSVDESSMHPDFFENALFIFKIVRKS